MPSAKDEFDYEAYAASSRWDDCLRRLGFTNSNEFLGHYPYTKPEHCFMCWRRKRNALIVWNVFDKGCLHFRILYVRSKTKQWNMGEHTCTYRRAAPFARLLIPIARRLSLGSYKEDVEGAMSHAHLCVVVAEMPPTGP